MSSVRVVDPGALLTVQDRGRRGRAHLGVARSGAADRASLALANRLVGNTADAAGLEVLGGRAVLEATSDVVVAVTGAVCDVRVDDRHEGRNVAVALHPGDMLRLGPATVGIRAYVALRGGVDLPPVLGSRSLDVLGALGPPPLTPGQLVPLGDATATSPTWEEAPAAAPSSAPVLRIAPGPRLDWLDDGLAALTATSWRVGQDSDRTGLRLEGPPLARRAGDLASEGTLPGGIQVPPDGRPIVLGPDAGVTGGYPLVAVVVDADLDALGQLAPGSTVRFRTT